MSTGTTLNWTRGRSTLYPSKMDYTALEGENSYTVDHVADDTFTVSFNFVEIGLVKGAKEARRAAEVHYSNRQQAAPVSAEPAPTAATRSMRKGAALVAADDALDALAASPEVARILAQLRAANAELEAQDVWDTATGRRNESAMGYLQMALEAAGKRF